MNSIPHELEQKQAQWSANVGRFSRMTRAELIDQIVRDEMRTGTIALIGFTLCTKDELIAEALELAGRDG